MLAAAALSGPSRSIASAALIRRPTTGTTADPVTLVSGWARLATEVAPRVAPVLLLARAAAQSDPRMREEYDAMTATALRRMQDNARALAAIGGVREGISVGEAGDVLFAVSSLEMYELLVIRRGWSVERYSTYLRETITHALLP